MYVTQADSESKSIVCNAKQLTTYPAVMVAISRRCNCGCCEKSIPRYAFDPIFGRDQCTVYPCNNVSCRVLAHMQRIRRWMTNVAGYETNQTGEEIWIPRSSGNPSRAHSAGMLIRSEEPVLLVFFVNNGKATRRLAALKEVEKLNPNVTFRVYIPETFHDEKTLKEEALLQTQNVLCERKDSYLLGSKKIRMDGCMEKDVVCFPMYASLKHIEQEIDSIISPLTEKEVEDYFRD